MKKIPFKLYKRIIDVLPILCVDAAVLHKGKFILVKRKNEPLKGGWWVPGGRVLKGETLEKAIGRKVKEELGIKIKIVRPFGYFEHYFRENEFGVESGIHQVSIVFLVKPVSLNIKLDKQSGTWKFSKSLPKIFKIQPFS